MITNRAKLISLKWFYYGNVYYPYDYLLILPRKNIKKDKISFRRELVLTTIITKTILKSGCKSYKNFRKKRLSFLPFFA